MFWIKNQGQIEHVTVLTRPHVLDSGANANLNQLTLILTLIYLCQIYFFMEHSYNEVRV